MLKDKDYLFYLIIGLICAVSLNLYHYSDSLQLKCVISVVDGNKYCVRVRAKLQESADMLARTTQKCKQLVAHLREKYKNEDDRVNRLATKYNPKKVYEILPTSKFTAYSENKGQKLAFCLNTTKKGEERIDENTLMFVAIHELSHIASEKVGHGEEFWSNFKFLLQEAQEIKIYNVINYKENPKEYCGMTITSNPYFRKGE